MARKWALSMLTIVSPLLVLTAAARGYEWFLFNYVLCNKLLLSAWAVKKCTEWNTTADGWSTVRAGLAAVHHSAALLNIVQVTLWKTWKQSLCVGFIPAGCLMSTFTQHQRLIVVFFFCDWWWINTNSVSKLPSLRHFPTNRLNTPPPLLSTAYPPHFLCLFLLLPLLICLIFFPSVFLHHLFLPFSAHLCFSHLFSSCVHYHFPLSPRLVFVLIIELDSPGYIFEDGLTFERSRWCRNRFTKWRLQYKWTKGVIVKTHAGL